MPRITGEEDLKKLGAKLVEDECISVVTGAGVIGLAKLAEPWEKTGSYTHLLWAKSIAFLPDVGLDSAIPMAEGYDVEVWREAILKLQQD